MSFPYRQEAVNHAAKPCRACRTSLSALTVDVTAAEMLGRLDEELGAIGVRLLIARDVGQVRDVLRTAGAGERRVYPTVGRAVDAAERR